MTTVPDGSDNHSWRKSSASPNGSDCVEIRGDLGAVRDSKNPDGPQLAGVSIDAMVTFIRAQESPPQT